MNVNETDLLDRSRTITVGTTQGKTIEIPYIVEDVGVGTGCLTDTPHRIRSLAEPRAIGSQKDEPVRTRTGRLNTNKQARMMREETEIGKPISHPLGNRMHQVDVRSMAISRNLHFKGLL